MRFIGIDDMCYAPRQKQKPQKEKKFKNSLIPGDLPGGMRLRESSSGWRRYHLIDCFIPGGHLAGGVDTN
jgi:hypothetical protein